jgi:hypothetical protein
MMIEAFGSGNANWLLPQAYQNIRFQLSVKRDSRVLMLVIHSSTLVETIACLEFLAGLQDSYFKEMVLSYCAPRENGHNPICPTWRSSFSTMKVDSTPSEQEQRLDCTAADFKTMELHLCRVYGVPQSGPFGIHFLSM